MNEQQIRQIRQIVRQELSAQAYQSGAPIVPRHTHDNVNSPKISQSNITPAVRTSGSIQFAHIGQYIVQTNGTPNPTLVLCYGNVVNTISGSPSVRAFTFGSAQLGQSYYLQPDTISTVKVGGPIQPFIQSCSYFSVGNPTSSGPVLDSVTLNQTNALANIPIPVGGSASFVQTASLSSHTTTVMSNEVHTLADEGHIVDFYDGTTINARMDIIGFSPSTLTFNVSNLNAGWSINVNVVVI